MQSWRHCQEYRYHKTIPKIISRSNSFFSNKFMQNFYWINRIDYCLKIGRWHRSDWRDSWKDQQSMFNAAKRNQFIRRRCWICWWLIAWSISVLGRCFRRRIEQQRFGRSLVKDATTIATSHRQLATLRKNWKQSRQTSVCANEFYSLFYARKKYKVFVFFSANMYHMFRCNVKEGAATFQLINEYIRLVAAEKPVVLILIFRQVQQKCNANESFDEWLQFDGIEQNDVIKNALEKIKCIVNSTAEALKDSDFDQPLKQLKKDLKNLVDHLKDCKNKPDPLGQAL